MAGAIPVSARIFAGPLLVLAAPSAYSSGMALKKKSNWLIRESVSAYLVVVILVMM